jgi:hypothetical protein
MTYGAEEMLKGLYLYPMQDGSLMTALHGGAVGLFSKRGRKLQGWDIDGHSLTAFILTPEEARAEGIGTVLQDETREKLSRLSDPMERALVLATMNAHWRRDPHAAPSRASEDELGPLLPESDRVYCTLPFPLARKVRGYLGAHERGVEQLDVSKIVAREDARKHPLAGHGDRAIALTLEEIRDGFGREHFDRMKALLHPQTHDPRREVRGPVLEGRATNKPSLGGLIAE